MFKGFTAVGFALFSGILFAAPTTTCPNLNEINSNDSFMHEAFPIVPGKLYASVKVSFSENNNAHAWAIFVGPVKSHTGDAVSSVVEYILSTTAVTGELQQTEEGPVCSYKPADTNVFVTAMEIDNDDIENNVSNLIKKLNK